MGNLGCGCAAVAALLALVTALPFLGWANWLLTIPVALAAVLISVVALSRGEQSTLAAAGLIVGIGTLFWAMFRLAIGGGFL
jgi:thiamine transporter ThiT